MAHPHQTGLAQIDSLESCLTGWLSSRKYQPRNVHTKGHLDAGWISIFMVTLFECKNWQEMKVHSMARPHFPCLYPVLNTNFCTGEMSLSTHYNRTEIFKEMFLNPLRLKNLPNCFSSLFISCSVAQWFSAQMPTDKF